MKPYMTIPKATKDNKFSMNVYENRALSGTRTSVDVSYLLRIRSQNDNSDKIFRSVTWKNS